MAQRYDDPYEDWGITYDAPAEPAPEPAEYKSQGEFKTSQWITAALESTGLQDTALGKKFDMPATEPSAADYRRQYELMGDMTAKPKESKNIVERLFGRMGDGLSSAYDKDPLKFLEMGLGAVGGVYKAQQARDAAALQSRSAVDAVNARAAAEKEAQDRYNASFSTSTKRGPAAPRPLTRMDGTQIFDANGRLKG